MKIIRDLFAALFVDNCWCLYATPNTNNTHSITQIYLRLIRIPAMIKSVKIAAYFETNTEIAKEHRSLMHSFCFEDNSLLLCSIQPSKLIDLKQLILNVNIEILKAYDHFDNFISKRVWDNYGIKTQHHATGFKKIGWKNKTKLRLRQKLSI